jgi:hypothetical protein
MRPTRKAVSATIGAMTHNGDDPELEHAAALRRASDDFMQRLDRLHELETRKRELPPDQPEFVRIAREVEDLSRALLFSGGQEVELAETVHVEAKRNDIDVDQSIRDTPPRRDAVIVLADWRAAERRLMAAALGSEDERSARADVDRLRAEYGRLTSLTPGDEGA